MKMVLIWSGGRIRTRSLSDAFQMFLVLSAPAEMFAASFHLLKSETKLSNFSEMQNQSAFDWL